MSAARFAICLLVLLLGAVPAAGEVQIDPTLRTERVYFHCVGPVKAQNVALGQGTIPSWSVEAPTQSVQQGAGCGYYENAVGGYAGANRTTLDAVWAGTFDGNVDSVTVELHNIAVAASRATGPFKLRANLFIDGVDVIDPDAPQIEIAPVPSDTHVSEELSFTVTGLGLLDEDGDGSQTRQFELVIRSLSEEQSAWVWDTTEVPAGLTFNPAEPAATAVAAVRIRS